MRILYLHIVILAIWLLGGSSLFGQDIHFSQFNQAPARLNPALTGAFKGSYRVTGIYRSQWGSVSVPYSTVAFSGDAHNFLKQKGLGLGVDFFFDQAGDGNLGTLNFNVSGAYQIRINTTSHLTGGLQLGFAQRQIDQSNLVFGSQAGSGNSLESFNPNSSYMNANAGLAWHTKFENRKHLEVGFAIHNLTQPDINFYDNDSYRLDMRYTFHAKYQFKVSEKVDLIPSILYMNQGPHQQITPGINGKYILDNRSHNYRAVYLGLWTRAGDAGFVSMGMDWNTLNVGISYDFNYSDFSVASRYRGGFEISFIYIFKEALPQRKFFKTCPEYL